jgi:ferritin-like metal-binding protein YciE
MAINSMQDLLVEELRELLDAEKQALRAYPRLIKAVSSERLKQAFEEHSQETEGQVERLNEIFEELDTRPRAKTCEALRGLVEDAQAIIKEDLTPELLDVALIAAAQKMEHFEIAAYGSAQAHAEALEIDKAAELLEETLGEEKAMDQRLNEIALEDVNERALEAEQEEGEEGEEEQEGEEEAKPQAEAQRGGGRRAAGGAAGGGRSASAGSRSATAGSRSKTSRKRA